MSLPKNSHSSACVPPHDASGFALAMVVRNLSTTMGHSTGLIREQCPVW